MRDPNRLDIFYEQIKIYHKKNFPDLRFIQFIFIFLTWHENHYGNDGFYLEDNKCLKRFEEFIFDLKGGEK